jgi:hypothetical protein
VLPVTAVSAAEAHITLPAPASGSGVSAAWPSGLYSLALELPRPGADPWTTNSTAVLLAPSITVAPTVVQPPAATVALTVQAQPQVRDGPEVSLVFDDRAVAHQPIAPAADADAPTTITADVPGHKPGVYRVRLRVDGVESVAVVRTGTTAAFDPLQSVEVKP